jgi:hypothetical protein
MQSWKIELVNRQMTVDFVNKSVMGSGESEVAEQLGQMNTVHRSLLATVGEKIKMLDVLKLQWDEYETALNGVRQWLTETENRLEKWNAVGHEVTIGYCIDDLQVSRSSLHDNW